MRHSLIALVLILPLAGTAHAQSRTDKGVSMPTAQSKIEQKGYSNVQNLHREGDSSWVAGARDKSGAATVVGVDSKGKVNKLSH